MRKTSAVRLARIVMIAASLVVAAESSSSAHAAVPTEPGIWCERGPDHPISAEHERRLCLSLRRITGMAEIGFCCDGSLTLGDAMAVNGGALAARELLMTILHSGNTFVIQDHSGSDSVHFGQMGRVVIIEGLERKRFETWQ